MLRTFRYPLSPTVAQAAVLEQWRVACQQLYNGALQERRDAWQRAKVSIGYNDQTKSLTELRKDDPEWAIIPSNVERSALSRIDKSFKAFFRRVKAGDTPGFPRFKSRDRYGSIGLGRVPRGVYCSNALLTKRKKLVSMSLEWTRVVPRKSVRPAARSCQRTSKNDGTNVDAAVVSAATTTPPSTYIPVAYGFTLAEGHHDSSKREAHFEQGPTTTR